MTVAGARRYGVVVTEDPAGRHAPTVDDDATAELRAQVAEDRGDTEIFNFGGSIVGLRDRCEDETGLPAPEPPVLRARVGRVVLGASGSVHPTRCRQRTNWCA